MMNTSLLKTAQSCFREWLTELDSHLANAEKAMDEGAKAAKIGDIERLKVEARNLGASIAITRSMLKNGIQTGFNEASETPNN